MPIPTEKKVLVSGPSFEEAECALAHLRDPELSCMQVEFRGEDGTVYRFFPFYLGFAYCTRYGSYAFVGGPAEPSLMGRPPAPESRMFYVGKFNPTTGTGHLYEIPHEEQSKDPYLGLILFGGDGS